MTKKFKRMTEKDLETRFSKMVKSKLLLLYRMNAANKKKAFPADKVSVEVTAKEMELLKIFSKYVSTLITENTERYYDRKSHCDDFTVLRKEVDYSYDRANNRFVWEVSIDGDELVLSSHSICPANFRVIEVMYRMNIRDMYSTLYGTEFVG